MKGPSGPILARLESLAPHPSGPERLLRASWGSAPGRFGRHQEASAPGPMRIAVDRLGRLHVLDQVNRRIQVFDRRGVLVDQIGPVPETAEDLVLTGATLWVVAQPPPGADRRLRLVELSRSGRRIQQGYVTREAVLLTGLFAAGAERAPDLWLELRHREQIRVVREGRLLSPAQQRASGNRALGRPDRHRPDRHRPAAGDRLLAGRTGPYRATIARVEATGRLTPALDLTSQARPLVELLELASDARGDLVLALGTARAAGEPFDKRAVVLPAAGQPRVIDLVDGPMATDAFRPIAVADDGAVYQLHTTDHGVEVWRWAGGDR